MPKHTAQVEAVKRMLGRALKMLSGGEYGEKMNKKMEATHEGKMIIGTLKKEGFLKTLKKSKRGEFNR